MTATARQPKHLLVLFSVLVTRSSLGGVLLISAVVLFNVVVMCSDPHRRHNHLTEAVLCYLLICNEECCCLY